MNKRYWWIVITYILIHLSGIIGIPLLMGLGFTDINQMVAWWTIISFVIGLLIILLLLLPERGSSPHPNMRVTSKGHATKWAIIGVFLAFIAQYIAILIETYALGIDPGSENTQEILEIVRMMPFFAIIVALIGPILEEIVFRKVIFGALYKRMNFFFSALISALIFAVVHLDFEHLLVYMAVGFVFSYLYVKTGRIIVPILAHVAMNAYAVLMQVVLGDRLEDMQRQLEQMQGFIGGLFL
ncbi:CPBP family intramembrane glutamic endopeptidase [Thalassorhabdus alkalitolerans]|uniref:CPBP family intramembrane glutamic endopeptidase n=1 Tax=Thalassorhabdus alkalitolerans TaxID=2282697 RepID=A0ABW0YQW2_9BACI|nr:MULTISPECIES: type II CAAX endopeptidase family protein [Bacillaceae]